jgi:ABC-2 type transport system permease protein
LTFGVGIYALEVDVVHANWVSVVVAFGLSLGTFFGLGILSAAMLVAFKKGDPISYVFGLGSSIVSGALFPTELLPEWLRWLSYGLPMTHALEALRLALLRGYELGQLALPLASLGAMALLLLPMSLWLFTRMVERGHSDGSLAHH